MTMFCVASSLAMYSCLEPVVMASYKVTGLPVVRLPRCNLFLCVLQLELRQFLLLAASISTSAVWFVYRKSDWSWILQDILGIMFSINMLKVLRLPSLKICTILLSALFFYDIFFVFITPLFMEGGKSVMVEVATGHSSDEQLPMVLRVPHLSRDPSRVCYVHTYSLLGFGDILVPGLLLSFAHSYDLLAGIKYKLYWTITTVGQFNILSSKNQLHFVTCSLHPRPRGHLHLSLPDELCPARSPLPGPLHPPPHHPRGLAEGRPPSHVGRGLQGDHNH